MAAILKVWHHIKNPTPYLLEEQEQFAINHMLLIAEYVNFMFCQYCRFLSQKSHFLLQKCSVATSVLRRQ